MSLTLAKLAQLKRQAGAVSPLAPPPATPALPAAPDQVSIDLLRQYMKLRATPVPRLASADRSLPGAHLAPGLHLCEEWINDDEVPAHFDGAFDRKDPLPTDRLMFFDTETTGLAGGSGTRAFMIGAADWDAGRLRIRQLTIATTGAESAMLEVFRSWIRPDTVLVSYNGKSYDAPLLATRFRLARQGNPLQGLAHVDLLYPSRRRYRGTFENCRLATIERRVLQIVREYDLPGSEAPAAWLSFLRGGSAQNLRRVLAHNRQDVISLSRLLRHLSQAGASPEGTSASLAVDA